LTTDYIVWATTWAPSASSERAPSRLARSIYDEVDERLGDEALDDDFLTRVLWLEMAIRLARIGWTILEVEEHIWPVHSGARVAEVLREL
jgi:hypothetical protein